MYTAIQRQQMLDIAQQSIQHSLHLGTRFEVERKTIEPILLEPKACFITIKIERELHGCMGSLATNKPLIEKIAHNAYNAAFNDPRFSPITEEQISQLTIMIAVLSELSEISFQSEQELISQLNTEEDGIVLSDGEFSATFLPHMWQELPEPKAFITQLKINAGLSKNYWSDTIVVERFSVEEIGGSN